jgi:gamma-glutamyltranspeptidase
MTPTIVKKTEKLFMVVGLAPCGSGHNYISTANDSNVYEYNLSMQERLGECPSFHHQCP